MKNNQSNYQPLSQVTLVASVYVLLYTERQEQTVPLAQPMEVMVLLILHEDPRLPCTLPTTGFASTNEDNLYLILERHGGVILDYICNL